MNFQRIESLFSIPILVSQVGEIEFRAMQEEIGRAVENVKWTIPESLSYTHLLSTNNFDQDIIKEEGLVVVESVIDRLVGEYLKSLHLPKLDYNRKSWLTLNMPGAYTNTHNHGSNDISGVYYYDTNGEDGDFYYVTPTGAASNSRILELMHNNISYKPANGVLMLFPSFVYHGVTRNVTDSRRISLAFNIKFKMD